MMKFLAPQGSFFNVWKNVTLADCNSRKSCLISWRWEEQLRVHSPGTGCEFFLRGQSYGPVEPPTNLTELHLPRSGNNGQNVPVLMPDQDTFGQAFAGYVAGIRRSRRAPRPFVFQHVEGHILCLEELLERDGDAHGVLLSVADYDCDRLVGRENARISFGPRSATPELTNPEARACESNAIASQPRVSVLGRNLQLWAPHRNNHPVAPHSCQRPSSIPLVILSPWQSGHR
jgi:hypothetical protein